MSCWNQPRLLLAPLALAAVHLPLAAADAAGRVVKGAPYCAEAEHQSVQWLADAGGGPPNRIVRRQPATLLCRDGEGRTRQEVGAGAARRVYLADPVAGARWVLDTERKTARRLDVRGTAALDGAAWQDYGARMREWARGVGERSRSAGHAGGGEALPPPPVPPVPPASPMPPLPPLPVVIGPHGAGSAPHALHLRVVRPEGAAPPPVVAEMAPPPVVWRAQALAPRGAGTVTPLGSKDIDGIRATGERTTWVIEAGKVGNERPITITREVWTAPDLMVTLSTHDADPRSGESIYRLVNVRRGEPDAALMRVPADYAQPGR